MKGGHPFCDAATILDLQDLTLTLATDEGREVHHRHQGEGGVEFRRRRVLFRALICAVKGPGLSINYNVAPFGGFSFPPAPPLLPRFQRRRGPHRRLPQAPEGVGEEMPTNPIDPSHPSPGPICPATCVKSTARGQRSWKACSHSSKIGSMAKFPGQIW